MQSHGHTTKDLRLLNECISERCCCLREQRISTQCRDVCVCVSIYASVFYKCPLSNQRTFCCKLSICALLALLISQIGRLLAEPLNELEVVQ